MRINKIYGLLIIAVLIRVLTAQEPTPVPGLAGISNAEIQKRIDDLKNHKKKIKIQYDKFTNKTVIGLVSYDLVGGGQKFAGAFIRGMENSRYGSSVDTPIITAFSLTAGTVFDGEILDKTPTHYIMTLQTESNQWMFGRDSKIYFLFDNERLEIVALDRKFDVKRGNFLESLDFIISSEKLSAIANAKKIEVKAGFYTNKIKSEFTKMLGNLVKITQVKNP